MKYFFFFERAGNRGNSPWASSRRLFRDVAQGEVVSGRRYASPAQDHTPGPTLFSSLWT